MRWVHVFHDGSNVPACTIPVGRVLDCIAPHFQVITIGVEHTWELVGGDGDGAIHQIRSVGRCDRVNQRGRPLAVWTMGGGAYWAFLCAPAIMLLVVSRQLHVRRPVMFTARGVEFSGHPQVKHGLFPHTNLHQPVHVDGGRTKVVPVA